MEAPEELRGSLQQLSHLSSKFSARPENLLAEALREWAQRRGVLLEAPSEPGQAVEGHQEPAAGSDRRVVGGSSWANLPSMVEEDLFSSRLGGADAHAARVVCHAWKSAVEQNLRRLEASPRGSQGHGCICYLNRFRQVEELKVRSHLSTYPVSDLLPSAGVGDVTLYPYHIVHREGGYLKLLTCW
mmetsp:Transcript_42335/g.108287  ORF Transcript_42335/g.108287 Transcript_42335/m.108287 type:complete len:186 (-) Transcript_42335:636-1193(-)